MRHGSCCYLIVNMKYVLLLQKDDPTQAGVGMCILFTIVYIMYLNTCMFFFYSYVLHSGRLCIHVHILPFSLSIGLFHLTEKEHQHDTDDDDSGMGPSTFTDTKSTTFSEVSY